MVSTFVPSPVSSSSPLLYTPATRLFKTGGSKRTLTPAEEMHNKRVLWERAKVGSDRQVCGERCRPANPNCALTKDGVPQGFEVCRFSPNPGGRPGECLVHYKGYAFSPRDTQTRRAAKRDYPAEYAQLVELDNQQQQTVDRAAVAAAANRMDGIAVACDVFASWIVSSGRLSDDEARVVMARSALANGWTTWGDAILKEHRDYFSIARNKAVQLSAGTRTV